jgi:haloacetate dehalogenase
MSALLEGFTNTRIKTSGAEIELSYGGKGPPLLLMHGNPFTRVTWHKIAPLLAEQFTLVLPDLRGYGDSSKPDGGADHAAYSFRAMALDQIEVMKSLGFDKFHAGGHDCCASTIRTPSRVPRSSTCCRSITS